MKKQTILLTCLLLVLSLGLLAGCGEEKIPANFENTLERHAAAGALTEADLYKVAATDMNGTRLDVTMDASGVDLNTPGKYAAVFKAGTDQTTVDVYIYGPIALTYKGQSADVVELSFQEALESGDFTANVEMQDSFGNKLDVKKLPGSALFQFAEGTYEVTYEAYDRAGQGLQKTLTYRVTGNAGMTVETGKTAQYIDKELKLKVDLAGNTDVYLADGSGRIGPNEYEIADGHLIIYGSYLQTLGPGEKTLRLYCQKGSCEVKFLVTGEGKRASAPKLLNSTGSTFGYASVSGYGAVRDFRAKTPNSWDSRLFFQSVDPTKHGTICMDIYIYQSKILNSNGVLEDSKNGLAEIPFTVQGMSGEYLSVLFVDKETGLVVPREELKMKTWYTMKMDTSGLSKTTDVAIYCGVSNKWQARMYLADIKCYAPEKVANTTTYADKANTVIISQYGAKCTFTQTTYDDEQVFLYTTGNRYLPSSPNQRSLQLELKDREKQLIRFEFKMLSATDANGAPVTPMMTISDKRGNQAPQSANFVIVDEAGTPVATAEVGKWYTVYLITDRQRFFTLYPMGGASSQYQVRMVLRNLTTENAEFTQPFTTPEGNYCTSGMYKDADGQWIFACASFAGYQGGNTAWQRRILVNRENQSQYTQMHVDFMYGTATFGGVQALSLAAEVQVSVMDEVGHILDVSTLEVGKWYTAVFEAGGGLPLPESFYIYPLGYYDGTAAKPVEVVMSIKNIRFS